MQIGAEYIGVRFLAENQQIKEPFKRFSSAAAPLIHMLKHNLAWLILLPNVIKQYFG
ncbi:MAG: hypothetical protein ACJAYB_003488 [Psychromonas sp.]|jgi:hypothetical protein